MLTKQKSFKSEPFKYLKMGHLIFEAINTIEILHKFYGSAITNVKQTALQNFHSHMVPY